ncbi:MAG: transposase [Clostridia bacterium]|nr:transposase [Clostridia bacterium]
MADLPKRKNNRLKDYDYSSAGLYFVTICTEQHIPILADIVGAIHESPELRLRQAGIIVKQLIESLAFRFDVIVDKYVIMPNHIHMILWLQDDRMQAIRESTMQRSMLSQIVGYLKMNSSREIHRHIPHVKVWQRSYHDHIIRSSADYEKIWQYIDNNPAKWQEDRYYR